MWVLQLDAAVAASRLPANTLAHALCADAAAPLLVLLCWCDTAPLSVQQARGARQRSGGSTNWITFLPCCLPHFSRCSFCCFKSHCRHVGPGSRVGGA